MNHIWKKSLKTVTWALLAGIVLFIGRETAAAEKKPRFVVPVVIAKVDGDVVTESDAAVFAALSPEGRTISSTFDGEAFQKERALLMRACTDAVIQRKVMLAMAWKKKAALEEEATACTGVKVELPRRPSNISKFVLTEAGERITARIYNAETRKYGSDAAFIREMMKFKVTADAARVKMMEDFFIDLFLTRIESVSTYISPEEMRRFYDESPGLFAAGMKYTCRAIIIRKDIRSAEDASARALEALRRIKEGEDFISVMEQIGDVALNSRDGLVCWHESEKEPKEVIEAGAKLAEGGVSDLIERPDAYWIIRLEKKERTEKKPFEKSADEIKKRIYDIRRRKKIVELVQKGFRELKIEYVIKKTGKK
jgi:hypothetical protein